LLAILGLALMVSGSARAGADGTPKWNYQTGVWPNTASPAIGKEGNDNILYVGSDDGYLNALYISSAGLVNSFWPMFRHDTWHTGRWGCKNVVSADFLLIDN
jgi:hypothetical protein